MFWGNSSDEISNNNLSLKLSIYTKKGFHISPQKYELCGLGSTLEKRIKIIDTFFGIEN